MLLAFKYCLIFKKASYHVTLSLIYVVTAVPVNQIPEVKHRKVIQCLSCSLPM